MKHVQFHIAIKFKKKLLSRQFDDRFTPFMIAENEIECCPHCIYE